MQLWLASAALWIGVAALAATHQWATLRGGGKELTWLRAFAWQGGSWLLLIPATPLILAAITRWPLERRHPERLRGHAAASLAFAVAFLLVSVPARLAFHPSPLRWTFFGEAFFKSIPQALILALGLYWVLVAAASLIDARRRLAARSNAPCSPPTDGHAPATPRPAIDPILHFTTPAGLVRLRPAEIAWAEPAPAGARLHTDDGPVLVRQGLAELETALAPHAFVRTHRAHLVNAARIREILGSPSRDGTVRLDTGATVPVSRRRRAALDRACNGAPLAPESAPLA